MDYLPVSLKVSHLGMVALGLYVSIEGMVKLSPENTSENAFREVTVVAANVFGALAILFNMVNLYHTRNARNTVMRRSPRRK